ncbi:cell division protein SepF [Mycobacterium sp. D16R24]|uniref:cell division protein SepF n=1 Tax=Mycobacterium sp. D16R24 TaxID=1855656 RepID=UPI0009936779|nr:cell division protein SepF [Mycobacterium sp. D16R24]
MSTLHKVKAYFGMAPMDDYDDEYYDDVDAPAPRRASAEDRRYPRRGDRFADDAEYGYDEPGYRPAGYAEEDRFATRHPAPREFDRPAPRLGSLRGSAPTRGALAMDPRRAAIFEEGSPLSKITTLRPKDYSEARTIGERFRDGTPVIMDLVSMDNADAKRVVDFAAGLAFALRGSFDKVATKVFLLSPSDIDVSAEERRRIAESGFYSYQ